MSGLTLPETSWVTSMSPQVAPATFLPSHLKLMVAFPEPEATVTGSAIVTLLPPKVTSGLPVFSLPVTRLMRTLRSYSPMVTTFLTVPLFLTLRFLSSSVTWSTKPATTRWMRSRARVVGTPTRTGVSGMPASRGSLTISSFIRPRSVVALLLERLRSRRASPRATARFSRPQARDGESDGDGGERGENGGAGAHRHFSFPLAVGLVGAGSSSTPRLTPASEALRVADRRRVGGLHEVAGLEVHADQESPLPRRHLRDGDLQGHPRPVDPDGPRGHGGEVDALLHLDRDLDRGQLVLDLEADEARQPRPAWTRSGADSSPAAFSIPR